MAVRKTVSIATPVKRAIEHPALCPDLARMLSLLKNPPVGGTPARHKRSGQKRPENAGQRAAQSAHAEDILLMMHGGDDASGAQKQQGLEEGVDNQMEGGGGNRPAADGQHHEADLADG